VDPSVAVNAKFRIELMLGADGYYSLYANGVKVRDNKQMIDAGWATNYLDILMLHTNGTMPAVSTVYDTILIERGAEPVGEGANANGNVPVVARGTSIVPTGETATLTGNSPTLDMGCATSGVGSFTVSGNTPTIITGLNVAAAEGANANENTPVVCKAFSIAPTGETATMTPNTVVVELGTVALSRTGVRSQECFFLRQTRQEADF
jgi:hypothetical protein